VLGDASTLQQIIVNLCTNAEYAMRDTGGGTLRVSLDLEGDGASNDVVLSVSDTGVGMSPHVRDRLFEPFYTTKPVGEGTGMGLAVVHGIVRTHGGTISVQSTLGKGTTFRVTLPVMHAGTM
jgi:signal transduction histidine kinase